ncbi:cuticle protein 76-like [Prorops nasuta]|uniref:cuticle protein 76-like n=1 Tax=Prorops nasuta TaxID=863751 RepID=UPI0034CD7950
MDEGKKQFFFPPNSTTAQDIKLRFSSTESIIQSCVLLLEEFKGRNMAIKAVLLMMIVLVASARCEFIAEPIAAPLAYAAPTLTSQSSNILRSPGNLAQISTYTKTVDTPYSSQSKSDVRISNPGIYSTYGLGYAAAPIPAYAAAPAPAISYASTAPAATLLAKPLAYAAAAPVAPIVAHTDFTGFGTHYAF